MTILTEKESVAKKYALALNLKKTEKGLYQSADKKTNLTYAAGHLYKTFDAEDYDPKFKVWTLKDLPIIPQIIRYKADTQKAGFRKDCEKVLREAVRTGDEIIIATDPDREGEVIARLILKKVAPSYKNITRVWATEGVDTKEILKSIKNRKSDSEFEEIANQGLRQKESDWIFGINITRLITLKKSNYKKGVYSVGRVQTAVLKEIYNKEMRINLFLPVPYYECQIKLQTGTVCFLINPKNGKTTFDTKKEIEDLINKSSSKRATVTKKDIEKKEEKAPLLYDLQNLQKDAFDVFSISVDQTLSTAQSLYNEKGLISYPRADSRYLPEEDEKIVLEKYEKILSEVHLNKASLSNIKKENIFNTKKIGAHHAISISNYENTFENEKEKNIYTLILNRFLMQALPSYREEKNTYILQDGSLLFKCEGKKVLEKGWKELDLRKSRNETEIELIEGKSYLYEGFEINEKKTRPEKHFTQSSLISFMQNPLNEDGEKTQSLGTEATQSTIVKKLFERGYVEESKKNIFITKKGIELIEGIRDFPLLDKNTDVETTARWEEEGKKDSEALFSKIKNETKKIVSEVTKDMDSISVKESVADCPLCGGKIYHGKSGYYCSNYKEKDCHFSVLYHVMGNDIEDDLIKLLCEDKETDEMEGVKKDGGKCRFKFVINEKENKVDLCFINDNSRICDCPKCASGVFEKARVYKCENSSCDFFLWKETSGISFDRDNVKRLCNKEKIGVMKTNKDGKKVKVEVTLTEDLSNLNIIYK